MSHQRIDTVLIWTLRSLAGLAGAIVLIIILFLVRESLPALQSIGWQRFLTDASWNPLYHRFNMLPMILGSLAVTAGAILIASPLGIASAIFAQFYAPPKLAYAYRRLIELLAGIPSVVYGFWGLVVLVPLISHSLLAGILIVALMILPTIALIGDSSLAQVPSDYLRGAAALGLARWGIIWQIALPSAKRGLVTAIMLATARALGETMAVLMVCGNVVRLPFDLFDPIRTLTANIALEMAYATETHRAILFVSGLLLMLMVGLLILMTEWFSKGETDG